MLRHKVFSRDATGSSLLTHNIAGGTYSAAPAVAGDGFTIRSPGGRQYDAYEMTYSFNGGDATTIALIRPWFYCPDHAPGGTPVWLPARTMEQVMLSSNDVHGPVRRINSVPVGATKMYLQVDSIAGTAPADLYMVAYGIEGIVADVSVGDIEVDVEAGGLLSVKVRDNTTTDEAHVRDGDAAAAADDHVLVVQHQDAAGKILPAGADVASAIFTQDIGGGGGGGGAFVYVSPVDFTATYTAATQITLTGVPYVPVVEQFVAVTVMDSSGNATNYTPTTNAFAYNGGTGVLTITGASFDATDLGYRVMIYGPDKAYSAVSDTNQDYRTNPENSHTAGARLVSVTNGTNATYYYYIDCDTYRYYGIQFILSGAGTGSITVTLEATCQDDGTAPGSCTYQDVTNDLFGVANYTATDTMIIDTPVAFRYMRVKVVAATVPADQGDWTIYLRKIY